MQLKNAISKGRQLYVETMLQVVGRALQAISQVDESIQREIAPLPAGFVFSMSVMPDGPALIVKKISDTQLEYLGSKSKKKPDLTIAFKHISHAFLVFSFQESTATAFAHNRMLVDGDIGYALRVTRVLNRLESFILPKLLAERAVKEYPAEVKLPEKLIHGARIYLQMATNLVTVK